MSKLNWERSCYKTHNKKIEPISKDFSRHIERGFKNNNSSRLTKDHVKFNGFFKAFYKKGFKIFFIFSNIVNDSTGELFKEEFEFMFSINNTPKSIKVGDLCGFFAIPMSKINDRGEWKYFKKYKNFHKK